MKRERLTITLRSDIVRRLDKFIDGDTIRNRSHAIETLLTEKLRSQILSKAIMLGGGTGIEIDGQETSKLLIPLDGKTLVEHNIEILKKYGITDLILSMGAFGDQVRERLGDGSKYGIKIMYFERDPGRGSILRQAKAILEETFLMMNGDILLEDVDIEDMYQFHKNMKGKGTIMLATVTDTSSLGTVHMKGNQIIKFLDKPEKGKSPSHLINGGVYLFEPEVCQIVSPEEFSIEEYIFPKLAKEKALYGYLLSDEWVHLHDTAHYEKYLNSIKANTK